MELEGKVIEHLEMVSGKSARGEWKKQEFIVETQSQYPKKVCVALWGDKVNDLPNINSDVKVSINLESREYNGRWYTEVRAWKVENIGAGQGPGDMPPEMPPHVANMSDDGEGEDLPF